MRIGEYRKELSEYKRIYFLKEHLPKYYGVFNQVKRDIWRCSVSYNQGKDWTEGKNVVSGEWLYKNTQEICGSSYAIP